MDIDFIKWMVGYADGFHFENDGKYSKVYLTAYKHHDLIPNMKYWSHYPLLLQRAIEGIECTSDYFFSFIKRGNNKYDFHAKQEQGSGYWASLKASKSIYETIDQAKESALKYIYEQEQS